MAKKIQILLYLSLIFIGARSQNNTINWHNNPDGTLSFSEQNSCTNQCRLPAVVHQFDGSIYQKAICTFHKLEELTPAETQYFKENRLEVPSPYECHITHIGKTPYLEVTVTPVVYDTLDARYKKAGSYTIELIKNTNLIKSLSVSPATFSSESVLKHGRWIRIKIQETGIHQISYNTLKQWGFSNPSRVAIFGNGGEMLPVQNSATRPDDLQRCAIEHHNNTILFYAKGADQYIFNASTGLFTYQSHDFDTHAYYFLTERDDTNTPRQKDYQHLEPTATTSIFNDMAHHENNLYNLIRSGKRWFGERFDSNNRERTFNFNFPQIDPSRNTTISVAAAARSNSNCRFDVTVNEQTGGQININPVALNSEEGLFADDGKLTMQHAIGQSSIGVKIAFNAGVNNALGWLDHITINTHSNLVLTGSQRAFRSIEALKATTAIQYLIANTDANTVVWDVTSPSAPERIVGSLSQGTYSFTAPSGTLREYVAFNINGNFPEPQLVETVANQNLHALQPVNYIIVTHPNFIEQAQKLAQFHMMEQNLSVAVVTPQQIYNEFSSGSRDITAIRDFLRMLYKRSGTSDPNRLKYLLLMGDGSFNNKENSTINPNFIPTYQSVNSLHQSETYVSDDFYGFLDDSEGVDDTKDRLDIGIGRFPIQTTKQAEQAVDKSIRHLGRGSAGIWKKRLTFVGDDGDKNIHMTQADDLTKKIAQSNPEFDINKIYLDAYIPSTSSSGKTYPDAFADINRNINEGTLIFNFTGHGGGRGLSHESVVNLSSIQGWNNATMLSLFVTATCQFTRFDEMSETSAGEHVFLNPQGGAIALFSTTRIAYSHNNFTINNTLYNFAFGRDQDEKKFGLGEIIQRTKNSTGTNSYKMNFTLIGDPALPLIFPEHIIKTDSINGIDFEQHNDTLSAMSSNTLCGSIRNKKGELLSNFNGKVNITVYDKAITLKTRGNEGDPFTYSNHQSIIFKGSARVTGGRFKVGFIVPKDIRYNVGHGRISYYAVDDAKQNEAIGATNRILIGGASQTPIDDTTGPSINLWLNNRSFINGQKVGPSPLLIADLSDKSGINTTGVGIGHDITLFVDGNRANPTILNQFFETAPLDHTRGTIHYKINQLPIGKHTVELRAWDNMNNSSTTQIEFEVSHNIGVNIVSPVIYPNPCPINQAELKLVFDHDEYNARLKVEISIYNISGKLMGRQIENILAEGNTIAPITVETRGLVPGLHLVDVKIKSSNGREATFSKKIMFVQ